MHKTYFVFEAVGNSHYEALEYLAADINQFQSSGEVIEFVGGINLINLGTDEYSYIASQAVLLTQ